MVAQRGGVVRLPHQLAGLHALAARQPCRRGGREAGDVVLHQAHDVRQVLARSKAVLGVADGWLHRFRQRERAVAGERFRPAQQVARHADRQRADVVLSPLDHLVVRPGVGDRLVHVRRRGAGRGGVVVDETVLAVGEAHGRHPGAEDADHHRFHDGQREQRRHRGIDRIAAGRQHLHARHRAERVVRHHHPAHGRRRPLGRLEFGFRKPSPIAHGEPSAPGIVRLGGDPSFVAEGRRYERPLRTSSTFCGWSAALATRRQCLTTLPFGPTSTVERMTPIVFLPYIVFSP